MLPTPTPPPAPARVMQLSLWVPPAAPWHAELAEDGAPARGFDSPFELARFLAQGAPGTAPRGSPASSTRSASPAEPANAAHPASAASAADTPAAAGLR